MKLVTKDTIVIMRDYIFMLTTTVILIARINISFIIIPLILTPFLVVTVLEFKKKARANFKEIRAKSAAMNLNTQENIGNYLLFFRYPFKTPP